MVSFIYCRLELLGFWRFKGRIVGTLEKTVFKDSEPMKSFSRLSQEGQCPHSDENMLGDRNKETLVRKQVCQEGPGQRTDGCGGWG